MRLKHEIKQEYCLIWATVGSNEYLIAAHEAYNGRTESITIKTAGIGSPGSYAALAQEIEHCCKLSMENFCAHIFNMFIQNDLKPEEEREAVGTWPDAAQYDDFQIVREVVVSNEIPPSSETYTEIKPEAETEHESAAPEVLRAEWLYTRIDRCVREVFANSPFSECSNCGYEAPAVYRYCPHCGAYMNNRR